MSRPHLPMATVTAVLKKQLGEAVAKAQLGSNASVKTQRPDRVETSASASPPIVNVFLYQVGPNPTYRGQDLATRRPDGSLVRKPRIALDLHYLFTFFGDETKLEPQRLAGAVIAALHGTPIVSPEAVRKYLAGTDADPLRPLLADSPQAHAPAIRFDPVPLNLEELSKLWSVFFQVPYRLSVAYKASVIHLEPELDQPPRPVLPVLRPVVFTDAFQPVVVVAVTARGPGGVIVDTSTVRVDGAGFPGTGGSLRIGEVSVPVRPASEAAAGEARLLDERTIEVDLAGKPLAAGFQRLRLVVERPTASGSKIPVLESNAVVFALAPRVTAQNAQRPAAGPPRFTVGVAPPIAPGQDCAVVLNRQTVLGEAPVGFLVAVPPPVATTAELVVDVADAPAGTYFVRVRVDGVDSALDVVAGAFAGPTAVLA